jgi:hypothetical protein
MIKTIGFISGLLLMCVASSAFATTVKQEPPMGAMREGQVLLVDGGSCPTGQIKRVVGGNHTKLGGTKQVVRTISCVPLVFDGRTLSTAWTSLQVGSCAGFWTPA